MYHILFSNSLVILLCFILSNLCCKSFFVLGKHKLGGKKKKKNAFVKELALHPDYIFLTRHAKRHLCIWIIKYMLLVPDWICIYTKALF